MARSGSSQPMEPRSAPRAGALPAACRSVARLDVLSGHESFVASIAFSTHARAAFMLARSPSHFLSHRTRVFVARRVFVQIR